MIDPINIKPISQKQLSLAFLNSCFNKSMVDSRVDLSSHNNSFIKQTKINFKAINIMKNANKKNILLKLDTESRGEKTYSKKQKLKSERKLNFTGNRHHIKWEDDFQDLLISRQTTTQLTNYSRNIRGSVMLSNSNYNIDNLFKVSIKEGINRTYVDQENNLEEEIDFQTSPGKRSEYLFFIIKIQSFWRGYYLRKLMLFSMKIFSKLNSIKNCINSLINKYKKYYFILFVNSFDSPASKEKDRNKQKPNKIDNKKSFLKKNIIYVPKSKNIRNFRGGTYRKVNLKYINSFKPTNNFITTSSVNNINIFNKKYIVSKSGVTEINKNLTNAKGSPYKKDFFGIEEDNFFNNKKGINNIFYISKGSNSFEIKEEDLYLNNTMSFNTIVDQLNETSFIEEIRQDMKDFTQQSQIQNEININSPKAKKKRSISYNDNSTFIYEKKNLISQFQNIQITIDKTTDVKDNNEKFSKINCSYFNNNFWIHLPLCLVKYIKKKLYGLYWKLFVKELEIKKRNKIKDIQKKFILKRFRNISKKTLKNYFFRYKDNILIEKAKESIFKSLKELEKKKNKSIHVQKDNAVKFNFQKIYNKKILLDLILKYNYTFIVRKRLKIWIQNSRPSKSLSKSNTKITYNDTVGTSQQKKYIKIRFIKAQKGIKKTNFNRNTNRNIYPIRRVSSHLSKLNNSILLKNLKKMKISKVMTNLDYYNFVSKNFK